MSHMISAIFVSIKYHNEPFMKGVTRVKDSEIKKMEKSDSQALVYTASNYRLAEARREEEVKKGFHKAAH